VRENGTGGGRVGRREGGALDGSADEGRHDEGEELPAGYPAVPGEGAHRGGAEGGGWAR